MFYIVFVILLFMATVTGHISFCRKTKKPGLHAKVFGQMAFVSLVIYVMGVIMLRYSGVFDPHSLWGMPFQFTAGIIFILLVPVYLSFYVLTQLMSPSKKILLAISQRGELSYADILYSIQEEGFIMTRLNDLCTSGCVIQIDGRYVLTSEGQKIAAILNLMQLVLGRNVGG